MGRQWRKTASPKKKVAANYTWRNDEEVAGVAEDAEEVAAAADDVASAAADDADNVQHDDEADVPRSRGKMIIKLAHKSKTYETRFEFDTISFIWGKRKQQTPKSFAYATPYKHTETLTTWTEGWNLTAVHFFIDAQKKKKKRAKNALLTRILSDFLCLALIIIIINTHTHTHTHAQLHKHTPQHTHTHSHT